MKNIPCKIEALLQSRRNLALKLSEVSIAIDEYCERIGIDTANDLDKLCLCSDIRIYTEPWTAEVITRKAIEEHLNKA